MRDSTNTFGRRALLAGSGTLALSGCGGPLASGLTGAGPSASALTLWSLLGGGDGPRFAQILDTYEADHPEVDFKAITLGWGNPFYTKLSLATLGDRPPDVAVSHLTRAAILAEAGLLEPLDPADLERHGITEDRFPPTAWEAAHTNGRLHAVPLDTHPYVLFYNTEICAEAGLLDSDDQLVEINGPEEFTEALTAAQEVTGRWGGVTPIQGENSNCWRWFWTLYGQSGGELLADRGTSVVLDESLMARTLEFMSDLTLRSRVMPATVAGSTAISGFAAGMAGFLLSGEWEITTFRDAGTPFSMTMIPRIFDDGPYVVQADSHSFVLPLNDARDQEKRDTALTFVRAILDQSLSWAEGGHVPLWVPTRESAEFAELDPQANYSAAADVAYYSPPAWYAGSGSDLEYIVGGAVGAVLAGHLDVEPAIGQIKSSLQRLADTESPLG